MSCPLNNLDKVFSPTQSIHWYSSYMHSYSSDHLQASSIFSIDPCLVPTLTRSWSWPSSNHWRSGRKVQQLAILQAPMPSLHKNLLPSAVYLLSPILFFFCFHPVPFLDPDECAHTWRSEQHTCRPPKRFSLPTSVFYSRLFLNILHSSIQERPTQRSLCLKQNKWNSPLPLLGQAFFQKLPMHRYCPPPENHKPRRFHSES